MEENREFAAAQNFPFRLLSDPQRSVGRAYGVVRADSDQYAAYALRHSFLINPEGVIAKVYDVADVNGHAAEVLTDLTRLQSVP